MRIFRERDWIKYLPDGFAIYFSLKTFRGEIVSFSVVLVKDDECISRYDTAHGFAHRDIIGRKSASPVEKESYPMLILKEVFRHADEDFSENYARYYEYYQSH
jgi:hypothetical protein